MKRRGTTLWNPIQFASAKIIKHYYRKGTQHEIIRHRDSKTLSIQSSKANRHIRNHFSACKTCRSILRAYKQWQEGEVRLHKKVGTWTARVSERWIGLQQPDAGSKGILDCAKHWQKQKTEYCWKNTLTISEVNQVYCTHKLSKERNNKLSNKELGKKVSPGLVLLNLLALLCFAYSVLFPLQEINYSAGVKLQWGKVLQLYCGKRKLKSRQGPGNK